MISQRTWHLNYFQFKHLSTGEWISKSWPFSTVKYYKAMKMNEVEICISKGSLNYNTGQKYSGKISTGS